MILSCQKNLCGCLDDLNIKIHSLFQILYAFIDGCKKMQKSEEEEDQEEESY